LLKSLDCTGTSGKLLNCGIVIGSKLEFLGKKKAEVNDGGTGVSGLIERVGLDDVGGESCEVAAIFAEMDGVFRLRKVSSNDTFMWGMLQVLCVGVGRATRMIGAGRERLQLRAGSTCR
jgi:hypothetical protein